MKPAETYLAPKWLSALRWYLLFVIGANLVWEIAHLPLYTIWREGSLREQAFAVFHCTLGDALIGAWTVIAALLFTGTADWPTNNVTFRRVAVTTVIIAVAYTIYSEWLNTSVRRSWTYSAWMPVLPWIGTGLSPLLQWIVLPFAGFVLARRVTTRRR